MGLQIKQTNLDGVKLIVPPTIYEDFRGSYIELYNQGLYRDSGIDIEFIQDDISSSRKHVLRGIHGDATTWKLISCLFGSFYLVVVDNNPDSSTYRNWEGFTLSDQNRLQVLVPPNFGNGHVVMSDLAIFYYKQNTEYDRESQFTISWDDPMYGIWWPVKDPILSQRDQSIGKT
jgi:dTDP-4-dehydrorhamnose 3,5-epimerase